MNNAPQIGTTVRVSGTLVCKDKDGNVLKTIDFSGGIPLADIAPELAQQQGEENDHVRQ